MTAMQDLLAAMQRSRTGQSLTPPGTDISFRKLRLAGSSERFGGTHLFLWLYGPGTDPADESPPT